MAYIAEKCDYEIFIKRLPLLVRREVTIEDNPLTWIDKSAVV
jgi:hypothetical protein